MIDAKDLPTYTIDTEFDESEFLGTTHYSNLSLERSYLHVSEHLYLHYSKYSPISPPTKSLVIVHGFGEHAYRYIEIVLRFIALDYQVHTVDLAGFGRSGGIRFVSSVKMFHQNIHILLEQVRPDLPLFWLGHSMGSGLTLSFLQRNQEVNVTAVCISGPLLSIDQIEWDKKLFMYVLGKKLK
jgi:alpha-beta hydrolase superfamily lysophospholipase